MEMEHDHSAHANTTAAAAPGEISHPAHGTWEGHVLPGSFFLIWSTWWLISIFRHVESIRAVSAVASSSSGSLMLPGLQVAAQGQLQGPVQHQKLV